MGQISGSISLDTTKITRDTVTGVMGELLRDVPREGESAASLPLDIIAQQVASAVDDALAYKLALITGQLDRLWEAMHTTRPAAVAHPISTVDMVSALTLVMPEEDPGVVRSLVNGLEANGFALVRTRPHSQTQEVSA